MRKKPPIGRVTRAEFAFRAFSIVCARDIRDLSTIRLSRDAISCPRMGS